LPRCWWFSDAAACRANRSGGADGSLRRILIATRGRDACPRLKTTPMPGPKQRRDLQCAAADWTPSSSDKAPGQLDHATRATSAQNACLSKGPPQSHNLRSPMACFNTENRR
jgi:hypothetical protein